MNSIGQLYDNLYCVPDGTPELTIVGNKLKVGLCPKKATWLPGSTGNVMNGVGAASHIAVGFSAVVASLYAAM